MIQDPLAEQQNAFGPYKMMLMMDPPQHTAFRRLIREEFTAPARSERTPRMQALARQIVDAVIEERRMRFREPQVAGEMPSYVIAELMGMPLEDGRELYKLTETIHTRARGTSAGRGAAAVFKMFEYGRKVIAREAGAAGGRPRNQLLQARSGRQASWRTSNSCCSSCCWSMPAATPRATCSPPACIALHGKPRSARMADGRPARAACASRARSCCAGPRPVIYMRRTAKARHRCSPAGKSRRATRW